MRGRLYGLLLIALGSGLTALAWFLGGTGLDLEFFQALFFVGPTLLGGGLVLLFLPGSAGWGEHDFADWFELLPTRHRIAVYVGAGCGLATGVILLLVRGSLLDFVNPF